MTDASPADWKDPPTGLPEAESGDGLSCSPLDQTVRAIWDPAYAAGREHGCAQAIAALRLSPIQRRLADLAPDLPGIEPEASEIAYERFVDAIGSAPLADFDRFVEEHAFWAGFKEASDAVLNEYTPLGATAARAHWLLAGPDMAIRTWDAVWRTMRRAELYPGLLLAAFVGVCAVLVALAEERVLGAAIFEPLVLALLLGVAARNLPRAITARAAVLNPALYAAGAGFAAKQLLELAVGLLGASVDLRQMLASGPALLALIVAGVGLGLSFGFLAGRTLGLGARLATLVAVGNSICGNSAIAAVAPVIRADRREVATAIALTAVLGVVMVLSLPLLVPLLGLNHYQYGVLAGMSVYAVPQVVAAAFPVSLLSGEVAIFVKLSRVALLGPVIFIIALLVRLRRSLTPEPARASRSSWTTYAPWFLLMFFGLGALRSLDLLPALVSQPTRLLSHGLTILAMAGLGFGVELAAIRTVGPRVGAVVAMSLLFMTGATLFFLDTFHVTGAQPAQAIYWEPNCAPGQRPEFVLGFRALRTQLGATMGAPIECLHTTPGGDAVQRTTRGQAYYRMATNTVAFTDGWERFALSPEGGLLYWTGTQLDPPATATRIPPL